MEYFRLQHHLRIKRVFMEPVHTLELMGVGLSHGEFVLGAFEDLSFVHLFISTPVQQNFRNGMEFIFKI